MDEPAGTVTAMARQGGAFNVGDVRVPDGANWGGGRSGVVAYDEPVGAIAGESLPTNGAFSLGDVREPGDWHRGTLGVVDVTGPAGTVTANARSYTGAFNVGDLRLGEGRFNNVYKIVRFDEPSQAVTGGGGPSSGGQCVGDVRPQSTTREVYGVVDYRGPMGTVTGQAAPGSGNFSLGDVRLSVPRNGENWAASGAYGVNEWTEPSKTVTSSGCYDNSYYSVGDVRLPLHERPEVPPVIISIWGTWNRPFTTLELAAIQGYPWEECMIVAFDGRSDSRWREHIGNSVPPPAAAGMASVMAHTILLARAGVTFQLAQTPIWVRRHAIALSVNRPRLEGVA